MKNLLYKEFVLATPPLTYLFLSFTLMTFLPGYPILCGAFFVCLGQFQGYQLAREDHDILYSVLLPIRKTDVVKAKYAAAIALQMIAFFLCAAFTLVRMGLLSSAAPYQTNVLMSANLVFLSFVLLIFAAFNAVFLGGFFKTAHRIGKPFVAFSIVGFVLIGAAETLHHLPGLHALNAPTLSHAVRHLPLLAVAFALYAAVSVFSCRVSQKRFDRLDL